MKITVKTNKGVEQFRRAGMLFTSIPMVVEVDERQYKRIAEERMLVIVGIAATEPEVEVEAEVEKRKYKKRKVAK